MGKGLKKTITILACSFCITLMFYYFFLYTSGVVALLGQNLVYGEIASIFIFIAVVAYLFDSYRSFAWAIGFILIIMGIEIISFILITAAIGYIVFGPLITEAGFNIIAAMTVIAFLAVGIFFVLFGLKLRRFSKIRSEEHVSEIRS